VASRSKPDRVFRIKNSPPKKGVLMKLENMSKHEAKKQVVNIFERIAKKAKLSDLESYFLEQIRYNTPHKLGAR